jgi:hypothetical protein
MTNYQAYRICRLCGEEGNADGYDPHTPRPWQLVRYGSRHYAHPACYLKAGKPLRDLSTWALQSFPWPLIVERDPVFAIAFKQILADKQAEVAARRARLKAITAKRAELAEEQLQRDQLTLGARPRVFITADGYTLYRIEAPGLVVWRDSLDLDTADLEFGDSDGWPVDQDGERLDGRREG